MKITKTNSLVESTKLHEEDLSGSVKVSTENGGVTLETDVAVTSEGQPETKQAALKIKNSLTKILDTALAEAEDAADDYNEARNCNVLVKGLPGSSKTRTILNWAAANNCTPYYLDAKNPDIQLLTSGAGSIDREDPKHPEIRQAYTAALNKLDRPRSILFLDELNRQVKDYLRGSLLSLVADKAVAGEGPDGFRYFNNLLFTIAAVNPPVNSREEKIGMKLNDAEKRRFHYHIIFNSEKEATTEFITQYYDEKLRRYAAEPTKAGKVSPAQRVREAVLTQYIGQTLVSDKDFHYSDFDTYKDDIANAEAEDKVIVCQSVITDCLQHSHGKIENIINEAGILVKRGKEMIESILKKIPSVIYTDGFIDSLIAKKSKQLGIDLSFAMSDKTVKAPEDHTKEEKPAEAEDEFDFSGKEDDTDFDSGVDVDTVRKERGDASDAEIAADLSGEMHTWGV